MANVALTVTLNQSLPGGRYSVSSGTVADPNGTAPASATVAANVATLVADGASPTQGHVTTLNTNWGTFLTAYNLYTAGVATLTSNFTLLYNPASVTNINQVRTALREFERMLSARGLA